MGGDGVVFTRGTSERGREYFVYCGGADTAIGVATIDCDQLIDFARYGEPWRG